LDKRLKEFQDAKAVFDCVTETHRSQINRIFIKGQGAERKLGTYSPAYAKLKKKKGREASFVNFNFTGMLGIGLRYFIKEARSNVCQRC
jgi:hypothetical protein